MKNLKFLTIFALSFVIAFTAGFTGQCSKKDADISDGVFRGVVYSDHTVTTAKGARVNSRKPINPAILPLIDRGIDKSFRIAANKSNGYDVSDLNNSQLTVWLFPRSPKCIDPAFLVDGQGTPYDNAAPPNDYDKDPRVGFVTLCAAGMMTGENSFLISDDPAITELIAWYENEHTILVKKDWDRFVATQYHTEKGHPILGEEDGGDLAMKSIVLSNLKDVVFTVPADITLPDGTTIKKGEKVCVLLSK